MDSLAPINAADPVNRHHPLVRGRSAWLLTMPPLEGGRNWYDLMGLNHCSVSGGSGNVNWKTTFRPGGWGGIQSDGGGSIGLTASTPIYLASGGILVIASWVKLAAIGTAQTIAATYQSYPSNIQYTFRVTSAGKPDAYMRTSGGDQELIGSATLSAGIWYRLGVIYNDIAKTISLYVNGALDSSTSYTGTPAAVTSALTIFKNSLDAGGSEPLAGVMDDIFFATRVFSAAEMFADYESGRRGHPDILNRILARIFKPASNTALWSQQAGAIF